MVSSDTVVGIVGAVILTGAMIAVFYYENSNAADPGGDVVGTGANLYTYRFDPHEHPLFTNQAGSATLGTPVNIPLGIPNQVPIQDYLYRVNVTVTWTDDVAVPAPLNGPDQFSLELMDGATSLQKAEAGASPRELTHGWTVERPANVAARGDTPEAANASLKADYPETVSYSNLTLVVTLTSTGAQAQVDNANPFAYTVTVSYWKPMLV